MKVHRTLVHRGLSAQRESVFHLSAAVSVSTLESIVLKKNSEIIEKDN